MKLKLLIAVLFALFIVSFASATNFAVSPGSVTFTQTINSTQFTVTNTNSSILLNMIIPSTIQINGNNGYVALFNINGDRTNINVSSPRVFNITPQTPIDFSRINIKNNPSSTINIGDGSTNSTFTVVLQNSFCKAGNKGNLRIEYDITNKGSYGDENTWYPLDKIEVEVTVKNSGSNNINDIVVKWGLYNTKTGEFIIDDEEKKFDLNDGDDKTITFEFEVDPDKLNTGDNENDFVFLIKAYSVDEGEEIQCQYQSDEITIARDNHFVVFGDVKSSDSVQCGEVATISGRVWNIGDSDEKDVFIKIFNKKFGIERTITAGNLDTFESKKISFDVEIPKNFTVGTQYIDVSIYDEDSNIFENDDNDQSLQRLPLNISGGCEVPKSVSLSAVVDSEEVIAGQEAIIKVTLKNTGAGDTTYQLLITGVDSWATIKSIEPRTLTLKTGETKDAIITFIPDKSVKGDQKYKVQVAYGSLVTETEEKTLAVSPAKGLFNFTGFSISNVFGNNGFIWAIAALNIILVALIVIIAIRIARK